MGDFPDAQGQLTPQSEVETGLRDIRLVLVTPKNEEDSIKTKVARVATTFSPL